MAKQKRQDDIARSGRRTRNETGRRIVLHAITLFNRHGVRGVAIERICSELEISPGHFTYYFPRKGDLIQEAVGVMREALRSALARPVSVKSPADGVGYLIRVFQTFWQFRFYFNSIGQLLADDAALRKQYPGFREWLIEIMEGDLDYLACRGHFRRATPPNSFALLAENIFGLVLNWLRARQIENPAAPMPTGAALRDIAIHLWSLCQHWMRPAFAASLLDAFADRLEEAWLMPPAPEGASAHDPRVSKRRLRSGSVA